MKKFIRSLSLVLVVVTLCLTLASCKMITGSYTAYIGGNKQRTYTFTPFGIVTSVSVSEGVSTKEVTKITYRYKIENTSDDKMEITLTRRVDGVVKTHTYPFEQGENYITFENTIYYKN